MADRKLWSVVLGSMFLLAVAQSSTTQAAAVPAPGFGQKIISPPVMMDSRFNELTAATVGQQVLLSTAFANTGDTALEYLLLTEARNDTGVTIFLQSRWGTLESGGKAEVRHVWRPGDPGIFELRSFLISAECVPEILTPVSFGEMVVKVPDGTQTPVPRVEDLTREQLQRLTSEEIEAIEREENIRSDIDSEASEAEDQRIIAKEHRIRSLIWSDERIKEYQETADAFGYDSEFVMDDQNLCDNVEMTILLARDRHIEGDWQTSYVSTLSGRLELKVSVVNGAISSIVENPLDEVTNEYSYTEQEKKAIRIAVEDEKVQALFQDEEMQIAGARVSGVYSGGCDICAIIVIHQKEDMKKGASVILDVSKELMVSIRPNLEWISKEPERTLAVVRDGQYLIEVSFNDPIDKATFNNIRSNYDINIDYFEYRATQNITGGASTEVLADLEQLEADLMSRHDATLIGVTEIGARGKVGDWLEFLKRMGDNISETNVVQVL